MPVLGQDIEAIRRKDSAYSSTDRQKGGLATTTLLLRDLSMDEHISQAFDLRHPFNEDGLLEQDLEHAMTRALQDGPSAGFFALSPLQSYTLSLQSCLST